MPVSYDASSLLKCTVSMSYIRYVAKNLLFKMHILDQIHSNNLFNAGGFLLILGVEILYDRATGSRFLGDMLVGIANQVLEMLYKNPAI